MFRRTAALWILFVVFAGACASEASPDTFASGDTCNENPAVPSPTPGFFTGKAILKGDEGTKLIRVEIAETDQQRGQGLMFRECLDENSGMIFVFFEPTQAGFWMKNTKIPLSIAFFDIEGNILRILDMEPCETDPCESYDPGVAFVGALEVNQGAFAEWGVEEGDHITIVQDERDNLFGRD